MTPGEFDEICAAFTGAQKVVQWGGAHVWKVGGKVFAIGGWSKGEDMAFTFKAPSQGFEMLCELGGVRPAPYMASRGLKWVQRTDASVMSDTDLKAYLQNSYEMVSVALPRKKRLELGLLDP